MALHAAALSFSTGGAALAHYLEEIRQFPMLGAQEEFMLAKRWREHGDRDAAHKLVTSHLRLVAKIAMGYRGYGFPAPAGLSGGNVGLMQAGERFEPDKGFEGFSQVRLAPLVHEVGDLYDPIAEDKGVSLR